jgi:hypothetical protein
VQSQLQQWISLLCSWFSQKLRQLLKFGPIREPCQPTEGPPGEQRLDLLPKCLPAGCQLFQFDKLGGFDPVVNVWQQPESVTQLQVLLRQVEVIQPVEPDFMTIGPGQDRLPNLPILFFGIDDWCLDDQEPRAESLPAALCRTPSSPPSTSIFMKSMVRSLT